MENQKYFDTIAAADLLGISVHTIRKHLWKASKSPLPRLRRMRLESNDRFGQPSWVWTLQELLQWDISRKPPGRDFGSDISPASYCDYDLNGDVRDGKIVVITKDGDKVLYCANNPKNTRSYEVKLQNPLTGEIWDDTIWNNAGLVVIPL